VAMDVGWLELQGTRLCGKTNLYTLNHDLSPVSNVDSFMCLECAVFQD